MVSDSSKCSGLSLSTGADRENARDDTTSLASELGVETATRVPASALRLRVAGNAVRTAVRRPRRACERRALANILVLVERDVRNFPKTFPLFFSFFLDPLRITCHINLGHEVYYFQRSWSITFFLRSLPSRRGINLQQRSSLPEKGNQLF